MPFPEAARQRDLHRYYQPWLGAQNLVDEADGRAKALTYEGFQPQSSGDKSLTAFAQLAALRLNARRAMVSLIDSHRQYILAEATKTLSLFSHSAETSKDDIWLGNAIVARCDAICHHTFGSTYIARDADGTTYTSDCLIIPDCRKDDRFKDRDWVKGEPGIRFYAGVPITTKAGYHIGVYAVSDDNPREGLSIAEVRFMHDVAATVMEHLELAKDSDERTKGQRMVRGLTEFIERSAIPEARNENNNRSTTMERQTENARRDAITDEVPTAEKTVATRPPHRKHGTEKESETQRIFHRAARIIRQSTAADGVVFFDTSAAGIKSSLYDNATPAGSSDESPSHTTDFDTGDSMTTRRKRARDKYFKPMAKLSNGNVESADHPTGVPLVNEVKACPVVALSLRSGHAPFSQHELAFTETGMERYISRYPFGKFFSFNEDGVGINSSDERSERSETDNSDTHPPQAASSSRLKRTKEKFIPSEFIEVLPNVRSLIFLPLWDPSSERWIAGAFIWTTAAGRLMSPENELPYLKAFGNTITSEVARTTAQKSDRAKTTFIASISHELRSPLHGILGSVEFLHDTVASAYQESLVSSIETCGRTLLDTIDHVLDYAKINKLRSANAKKSSRKKRHPAENSILGVTTDFNLAQLVEEVCDTVCAGHTFRKTHNSHSSALHDQAESGTSSGDSHGLNMGTAEENSDRVAVTLNVAPFVSWIVRSQPGAVRRIVMNLLGNALKYTKSGFITVSLIQESTNSHNVEFALTVEDSGKGMSAEYQQTQLFSPFSQEDPFSSGTGLGLSIVKQIVESLKGEIDVQSTADFGTKITVSLILPEVTSANMRSSQKLIQLPETLFNKSVCVSISSDSLGGGGDKILESMLGACEGFKMQTNNGMHLAKGRPDFRIVSPSSLASLLETEATDRSIQPMVAVICICTDAVEKTAIMERHGRQIAALGWMVEIVFQPVGPRKLARVLLDSQLRATQLEKERPHSRSMSTHPQAPPNLSPSYPLLPYRSISDIARENTPTAQMIAHSRSPLISAAVPTPTTFAPIQPLSLPNSPTEERSEYFTPRVLLVDDNAINLKLLVVFARKQGLQYSEATNGLQAFETFKSLAQPSSITGPASPSNISSLTPSVPSPTPTANPPPTKPFDFILMDISMPIMDGLESTRSIRAFENEHNLPRSTIIALTGLASAQDQQDAVDAGVDMYLVKPVKFADIRKVFGGQ
ncbi:sensor histidine kinase-like protein/response regulator [Amniculicola lignicola CBS 123094]|uniref:histidine kinase n=1 Tax=Amniculicola lignicola CBS 123094 TaxID=1392246 RepID=A0A6A5W9F2_9PLEO|nr:sensor histidine kinase-like protein/response regulator [Amniculicola lignicola CBS 123094]